MERPDRIYRNNPTRNSTFDFRKHELEGKYMFSRDPDKPWWVGGNIPVLFKMELQKLLILKFTKVMVC